MPKKKTRASNGMGSIRQRKDKTWEARYSTPEGRQKSLYGKTEGEVTKKLKAVLHEIDTGAWMEPSKMTVGEWLEVWLRDYQGHTSGSTLLTYQGVVKTRLNPALGKVKMAKLSPIHVRRMVVDMKKAGRTPATIHHAVGIFSGAMRAAIEAGIIKSNPTDGIKLPKKARPSFNVIDREQIPAFVEAVEHTQYPNELLFMLYTGIRAGEVRGLRWGDIDFDAGTAHIQRQLQPSGLGFTPPKDGEEREIHLTAEAVDVLKRQRKRQLEQRVAAYEWHEDGAKDLVFRKPDGTPHSTGTIYRAVRKVGEEIGIPTLHPHELRHSYAVAALRSGVDVKTVQHNLGHAHASVTLDTYAAYTSDAGKEGAKKLSEYFKNAQK